MSSDESVCFLLRTANNRFYALSRLVAFEFLPTSRDAMKCVSACAPQTTAIVNAYPYFSAVLVSEHFVDFYR